jgi:hypothetical protein
MSLALRWTLDGTSLGRCPSARSLHTGCTGSRSRRLARPQRTLHHAGSRTPATRCRAATATATRGHRNRTATRAHGTATRADRATTRGRRNVPATARPTRHRHHRATRSATRTWTRTRHRAHRTRTGHRLHRATTRTDRARSHPARSNRLVPAAGRGPRSRGLGRTSARHRALARSSHRSDRLGGTGLSRCSHLSSYATVLSMAVAVAWS